MQDSDAEKKPHRSVTTPRIADLQKAFRSKNTERLMLWSGKTLDVELISVESGKAAGARLLSDSDRLILVESGSMLLLSGKENNRLNRYERAKKGYATIIPAGTWHDIICLSRSPLRLCCVSCAAKPTQSDPKTEKTGK